MEQSLHRGPRVVVIGVGSANFGPPTLLDLFENTLTPGAHLSLVDTSEERLEAMTSVATAMASALGADVDVTGALDRRAVLAGADAVLVMAEHERIAAWRQDWEIIHEFGLSDPLAENRGPAGLSHGLRTIPLVLAVARDVEDLAPRATLIVLTNPEDRIAAAVHRSTSVRVVGYCDGLWDFKDHSLGPALGIPGSDIHVEGAGINHAVWITDVRQISTGEDLLPRMLEVSETAGWEPFGRHLYETYGLWPHENDEHYGEYFPYACEFQPCRGYDFDGHLRDAEAWRERNGALVSGALEAPVYLAEVRAFRDHVFGDNPPSLLLRGLYHGHSVVIPNTNVPNLGKVPGLPADMIVEVPAIASPSGVRGASFEPFPDIITAFLYREGTIQLLAAEAAAEASRHKALQALMLDPHVTGAAFAERLLDTFLEAHAARIDAAVLEGLARAS